MKKSFKLFAFSLVAMLGFAVGVNAQEVKDGNELKTCLANGEKCVLTENIDIMDDDYSTDAERVVLIKDATLDLNGKTLKAIFGVEKGATFTIDSSKAGGKLIANSRTSASASAVYAEASKIIFNGGTITNENGYGFYALLGGTVIVNGGTVESRDSAVSGNNTTGVTYFEINGGVLTSKEGPALYQAGPVSLKIKDGVLNGGVQLRMGIVDITGGTINAPKDNIEEPKDVYFKSRPIRLPDTLSIIGGTYKTNEGNNNLKLTVAGGTFNSENGKGSAIAVYDLGNLEQKMNVNITGGTFKTTSKNRGSYDVLSLTDIGVTTPTGGFGNKEYVGKVSTSIKGGTFSSDVIKYVADKYTTKKVNNNYVVSENKTIESTDKKVTFESSTALDNNYKLQISESSKEEKTKAETKLEELYKDNKEVKDTTLITLYDIKISDGTNIIPMNNGKFTISIDIDATKTKYDNYKVIYIDNNGKISETLDAKLVDGKIVFETTHLSVYGIIGYNNATTQTTPATNPNTGDNLSMIIILGGLSLLTIGMSVRKLNKNN